MRGARGNRILVTAGVLFFILFGVGPIASGQGPTQLTIATVNNMNHVPQFVAVGEYVTPKYSKAFGPLLTGTQIEVGRLHFGKGAGAVPHAHPQEQVMVVISGRLRVAIDGQSSDLGPGEGFLAPPNVQHQVTALEDTECMSCKGLVDGRGHRI